MREIIQAFMGEPPRRQLSVRWNHTRNKRICHGVVQYLNLYIWSHADEVKLETTQKKLAMENVIDGKLFVIISLY